MSTPQRPSRVRLLAVALLIALLAVPAAAAAQTGETQPDPHDSPPPSPLIIRAFGSVQWGATEERDTPSSFTLGQFAVFLTGQISERVSVLAEIVMEGSINTRVVTDLERLQLTYRFNDALRLSAGRYHTGIGFYNAAFHHGGYFEAPIGRPRAFAFEDEGGILPVHEVGLTARGTIPNTGSALRYLLEVGNGRRWTPADEEEEAGGDENEAKSINAGLSLKPDQWPGFEAGVSLYRDTIPVPSLPGVGHYVVASFVTYRTAQVEVLAEWLHLTHRVAAGPRFGNNAGYVQASRAFGTLRPYYRYDRLAIEEDTPFIGSIGSFTGHTLGLRVDPAEWVGIKAQYERRDQARQRGVDAIRTELVFVF